MVDRDHVIPPLLSAAIQLRDSLPCEVPTKISPEISLREAATPYGTQKALRFAVCIPDVQAAIFAQLFNDKPGRSANVNGGSLVSFPLPEVATANDNEHRNPVDEQVSDVPPAQPVDEAVTGHATSVVAHVITDCGGVDHDTPSCPTWFPALNRAQIPADPRHEALFHFRMRTAVPGMKDRDYTGRTLRFMDMTDASPLAKEAVGSTSESLYVFGFSSTVDAVPALRSCVRGGVVAAMIFQGPPNGALGTLVDVFWLLEPMSNMVNQSAVKRGLIQDNLHQVKLARSLQKAFPRPVAFGDKEVQALALELASEVRLKRFGDFGQTTDVGCGGAQCALQ